MKRLLLLFICCAALGTTLTAQAPTEPLDPIQHTTYPVDSCLYLMDPMDMLVTRLRPLGGGIREYQTRFRSSAGSGLDYFVSGTGRFLLDSLFLSAGLGPVRSGDRLGILATLPDTVEDPDGSWEGGDIPFPSFLNGFIRSLRGEPVEPPIPIGLQVIRHEVVPLTD